MRTRLLAAVFAATLSFLALPVSAQKAKETEPVATKASDIPVETFFKRAEYTSMALSPNGKMLAAISPINGRENLVVSDLEKRTKVVNSLTRLEAALDSEWQARRADVDAAYKDLRATLDTAYAKVLNE